MTSIPVRQLTCIWMLTPPVAGSDGNRKFKTHPGVDKLGLFLERCVSSGNRDVRALTEFFGRRRFRYQAYGDSSEQYFSKRHRDAYFDAIPGAALSRSVVFFDPDNGMEPKRVVTEAHLRYSELDRVFGRMDQGSVAVVYQHRPRRIAKLFWPEVAQRLEAVLSVPVAYIAESDLAFYVIPRNAAAINRLLEVLRQFESQWPDRLHVGVQRS
jgi:hypothetical protein